MRTLLVLALALLLAACGSEDDRTTAKLRPCGGSYDTLIMTTEATADVSCDEALVFAGFVSGYTVSPSPCFDGGVLGGAPRSPCTANGWRCELGDDAGHGRAVFDCRDEDRPRRMKLTSFYALGDQPEPWSVDAPTFADDDAAAAYREFHLACRERTHEELAGWYDTAPERDAIIDAIGLELRGEARAEGRRGCKEGFAAYDVMVTSGAAPLGVRSAR